MPDKTLIIPGLAKIYYKAHSHPVTEAVITNTLTTSTYTEFGFQAEDGLTITQTRTEEMMHAAEQLCATDVVQISEDPVEITFSVKDASLAIRALGIAGSTYVAGATPGTNHNELGYGGKVGDDTAITIVAVSMNRAANFLVTQFYKVLPSPTVGRTHKHGEISLTEIKLRAFPDTGRTAGENIYMIYEATDAA